jgi:uncharacterized protein YndB with AHSA1/START domain
MCEVWQPTRIRKIFQKSLSIAVDLVWVLRHRGQKRAQRPKPERPVMSKPAPLNITVSTVIPAPADRLYELVADVTQMHRFSPENTSATWIKGATGPSVGATFKGTNQMGKAKWSTKPTVTVAEPGSRFAFKVPGAAGAEWSYTFTPVDGGTLVTESMSQQKPSPAIIRLVQRRNGVTDRAANLRSAMETTLARLATAA